MPDLLHCFYESIPNALLLAASALVVFGTLRLGRMRGVEPVDIDITVVAPVLSLPAMTSGSAQAVPLPRAA